MEGIRFRQNWKMVLETIYCSSFFLFSARKRIIAWRSPRRDSYQFLRLIGTLIKYVYHHEIPLSNYFSPWDLKFPFFNLPFNIWRVLSQLSPPQSSLPQLNKWFFLQYFLIGSQYNPVIIGFVPGRPSFILPGHAVQWLTLGYSTSYQFISQGSCDRDKIRWSQANYCTLSVQRMQRYKCSGVNK